MASASGRVVAFLEPIALYHERDLYEEGDEGWLSDYPEPGGEDACLLPGEVGVYGAESADLLVISYANGLRLSLRAARRLEAETGKRARVVDLRWLSPLPLEALVEHAKVCERILVVDECRATGAGIADAVVAGLVERGVQRPLRTVRGLDSYVPLADAANLVLVQEDDILRGMREVLA
jgi:2-oxoisovalerate dehydrogenase E1 component